MLPLILKTRSIVFYLEDNCSVHSSEECFFGGQRVHCQTDGENVWLPQDSVQRKFLVDQICNQKRSIQEISVKDLRLRRGENKPWHATLNIEEFNKLDDEKKGFFSLDSFLCLWETRRKIQKIVYEECMIGLIQEKDRAPIEIQHNLRIAKVKREGKSLLEQILSLATPWPLGSIYQIVSNQMEAKIAFLEKVRILELQSITSRTQYDLTHIIWQYYDDECEGVKVIKWNVNYTYVE